ncbi:MAG: hypothetical protein ABMA64_22490 [Myxococcota bacterium]
MNVPASQLARRRLTTASRRLGAANPVDAIGGLLDRSFELPVGDPRYGNNALTPGHLPLEHSFSEASADAFRLDLEPLGPDATPQARSQEASREIRRLVDQNYGAGALRWFDERSEPWRTAAVSGAARFGAWVGLATDAQGLHEAKVYYELRPDELGSLTPNLRHAARIATHCLPGLIPIFTSVACTRQRGSQRLYFFHRGDLRLLDLEPVLNRLGIGAQLPSLLTAVGVVLGGRFVLPEGSVILGLRDTHRGMELKLDVLVGGVPDPPPQMFGLMNLVLHERPDSVSRLRQWAAALTPDDEDGPGNISVVSFRVVPTQACRCSVYLRPNGYAQRGRRAQPPGHRAPSPDPYHV